MTAVASLLGSSWQQTGVARDVIDNQKTHSPTVTVVALGNAAKVAGCARLLRALDQYDTHVVVFELPEGLHDLDATIEKRLEILGSLGAGRPFICVGNSAGATMNRVTAAALKKSGANVVATLSDAPFQSTGTPFLVTALRGLEEVLRHAPTRSEVFHFVSYYATHLRTGTTTSRFCNRFSALPAVTYLNRSRVPDVVVWHQDDKLVSREVTSLALSECANPKIVQALEADGGHLAFGHFTPEMQLILKRFMETALQTAGQNGSRRAQSFSGFARRVVREAERTGGMNIAIFEPATQPISLGRQTRSALLDSLCLPLPGPSGVTVS